MVLQSHGPTVQAPAAGDHFFFSFFTGLQIFFFLSDVARHLVHAYLPGRSHSFGLSSRQPTACGFREVSSGRALSDENRPVRR
jgi:hypothetical protein